jgi:hypothetical protein
MNRLSFVFALGLGLGAQQLQAACNAPPIPAMPDGGSASMEQMLAGQKSVKSFQTSNMDYMHCLEAEFSAAKTRIEAASDPTQRAQAQKQYDQSLEAYNAAVSAEEDVAGAFNVELRKYRAANP